jgi:hypothetical protein
MTTQTLPKTTIIYNPFDYPVAEAMTPAVDVSGARAWSGEIDEETLTAELAETYPLHPNTLPEVEPDLFEQLYVWFIS